MEDLNVHLIRNSGSVHSTSISFPAKCLRFIDCGPVQNSVTKGFKDGSGIRCKDRHNLLAVPAPKALL